MSANVLKFSGAIRVGQLAADPSNPQNGLIYYNTTTGKFRKYEAGAFTDIASSELKDGTFRIQNTEDPTKQIAFDASGIATGTTRTITMPNSNVDLGLIATAIQSSEKGAANGVASLDSGGKIPVSQLPSAIMEYKGTYDASTNSPALADGVGDTGDVYRVSVAGTQDFGSGSISFEVGDYVIYNGSVWEKSDTTDAVASVNGFTGVVTLDTDDIAEGSNLYFTESRAKTAVVDDAIVDGVTDKAPSQNAVFDALALKLANVVEDTSPQLGGALDLNGQNVEGTLKRAAVGGTSDFVEEQYYHALTLTASQTDAVESSLSFAHATYEGIEVTYKIKEATTNRVRIGRLRVVTNGTDISIVDDFAESNDVGVTWSAAINGANVEVKYTTTANDKTMRADVKRFKA